MKNTGAGNAHRNGTKYEEIRTNGKRKTRNNNNSRNDKEKQKWDLK